MGISLGVKDMNLLSKVALWALLAGMTLSAPGCGVRADTNEQDAEQGEETGDGGSSGSLDTVEAGESITVHEVHQGCEAVDDCRAVYIDCSACEGACAGVHREFEDLYVAALDCGSYEGIQCDYDCHPQAGLTELHCRDGLCLIEAL